MNTIFKKQFFMHAVALIVGFILLGFGLTRAFTSFFIDQKEQNLVKQAEKISQVYMQALFFGGQAEKEVKKIERYLDCTFMIIDNDNNVLFTSSDIDERWRGSKMKIYTDSLNTNIGKGEILKSQGTMGGVFPKSMVTIGYPVIVGGVSAGLIFTSSPLTDIFATVQEYYKIIFLLMIIALAISFWLIYLFSRKISLPLIEINETAKIMADGNFDKKIYLDRNDEIGDLAQILNEMSDNLSQQEKRRREFISNISHDIRSPLTSMKGFVQALIDGTIPDEKKERYLNIILEETERLTRISNNILDINRLEDASQENKNVEFDINKLIRKIILSFEARLITKEIKINVFFEKEQIIVFADVEKIERVVYNLIDNAIKFIDNKKKIYISVKLKGEKALVSVKDEGKGIPLDMQKRIFERFYKADASRGEDKKGSGLGLSIVKEFILSQGETITLNSEVNKGSEFIFTLSLA